MRNGLEYVGIVGKDLDTEDAKKAARLAAVNVIAALKAALDGDLDRVTRVVKVGGFVNAVPAFRSTPKWSTALRTCSSRCSANAGAHARAAVGAGSLPRNVSVEVEAIFEVA